MIRVSIAVVVLLWASVASADVYPMHLLSDGTERATATATHIGDGVCLTCKHCFDPLGEITTFDVAIGEHPATLLRLSEDSDLATLYCEGLKDSPGYVPAPDGYSVEVGAEVTARGYVGTDLRTATDRVLRLYTASGGHSHDATEVECNITVHSGMSGGAIVDSNGYLIGIIGGNAIRGERQYCWATTTTSFWRVVYRVSAYHPWRPVLHIWTSNTCNPCREFWADFDTDANFRNAILANFRVPMRPDGTANKDAFNVDRHPVAMAYWNIRTVPTFGINPATRISGYGSANSDPNCPPQFRGMDRKGYLLARLGVIAPEVDPPSGTPPVQPRPPIEPQPTPVIHSTGPCADCNQRFLDLGDRLTALDAKFTALALTVQGLEGRQPLPFDDSALRAEIAALRAEMDAIELTPGPAGPQGPPGQDGEPRTITVVIEDDEGNRLAAPVAVPPTASTVRIPIERFVREGN